MQGSKLFRSLFVIGPTVAGLAFTGLGVPGVGGRRDTKPPPSSVADSPKVDADLAKLALSFEANRGQSDPQVKLLSRSGGSTLFLTPNEAVLSLPTTADEKGGAGPSVVRMQLVGGNADAEVTGAAELPAKVNYLSADPAKTHTNVPTYARAESKGVYPGIDVSWYGKGSNLEYDFIVGPGSDPSTIRLGFEGAKGLRLDRSGDLVMNVGGHEVRQHKPVLYQEIGNQKTAVSGRFVLGQNELVGFSVGSYDTSRPLIIDPVIVWSSYLGGSSRDSAHEIEVDAAGNVWLAGFTESTDFPAPNALDPTLGGFGQSIFVSKIVQTGQTPSLAYSTYLDNGDYSGLEGVALAVDGAGSPYIGGQVLGVGFPTTPGAYQTASQTSEFTDFVAKLTPDGSALAYSTYFSSATGSLRIAGLDVDAAGDVYIGGTASFNTHADAPTGSSGAYQPTCAAGTSPGGQFCNDAFLAKLRPTGNGAADLTYLTYLGGANNDDLLDVVVDAGGVAYLAGQTTSNVAQGSSPPFPTTAGAFDREGGANLAGQTSDGWAAKLDPAGNGAADLLYSTYLAGDVTDRAFRAAAGPGGALYAAGITHDYRSSGQPSGTNFPTTPGSLQPNFFPDENFAGTAFLVKLDPSGNGASDLVYSTLMGGVRQDSANGLAVAANGVAYLAGITQSDTFPVKQAIQKRCYCFYDLAPDAFVAVVNPDPNDPNNGTGDRGDLLFGTFLGGSGNDVGSDIALGPGDKMYVTGTTDGPAGPPPGLATAAHFPRRTAFQKQYAGGGDAFVTKISKVAAP